MRPSRLLSVLSLTTASLLTTHVSAQEGWFSQTSGTTTYLFGVAFTDANTGIVVGYGGTILRTTNGGTTWTSQSSGTTSILRAISFPDPNIATAVGDGGTILRTTDAGATWTQQASGTTHDLRGVSFVDANTGTAVGGSGTILRTTNGGATWQLQASGTTQELHSVSFADANRGIAVGGFSSGVALHTTNGGASWIQQPTTSILFGVSFPHPDTAFAVGVGGTIMRTTNGGATWATQTSGTSATLLGVSSLMQRMVQQLEAQPCGRPTVEKLGWSNSHRGPEELCHLLIATSAQRSAIMGRS